MNKIFEAAAAGLAGDDKRLRILILQDKITQAEYQVKKALVKLEIAKAQLEMSKAELDQLNHS